MMRAVPIDSDRAQREAADPRSNVWVSASAGSGKTKVLTDRVLTLLHDGTAPHRILCLTFTKAAAAEMANRVHRELAYWTISDDAELSDRLRRLRGETPDAAQLQDARRLFARVLDTPGGLKIQTIHSFCESLLGRFPIESGLAPQTQVMDERSAAELMQAARDAVLVAAQRVPALGAALAEVTAQIQEDQFAQLMSEIARDRGRLALLLHRSGGLAGAEAAVFDKFAVKPSETTESVVAEACRESAFKASPLRRVATALLAGTGKTDVASGRALADWLAAEERERAASFEAYLDIFLRKADRQPRARLATKSVLEAMPEAGDILLEEAERLIRCSERLKSVVSARSTAALLRLGAAMLDAYEAAKSAVSRLDYDDLIYGARNLLTGDDMTPWVLFKLDGGLDHILIDESQDTNSDQWEIVRAIADEFFAGEGARDDIVRTIFSVGDSKQSIFSFQRADPAAGELMRAHFQARAEAAEQSWRTIRLDTSFRSTDVVLSAVDAVFATEPARRGVVPAGQELRHTVHRREAAGRVEVWPLVESVETESAAPWTLPLERRWTDDPESRLAEVVARKIKSWIGSEQLSGRDAPVRAGDIMILVRRRRRIVDRLVRALKEVDVSVAGVDRLVLTQQLAVMDLMALAGFLLLPDDDLTLAAVLKGPLVGFDDDDLYRLASRRGDLSLWQRMVAASETDQRVAAARRWLGDLLARVDFVPPYELFAGVLTQPSVQDNSGRQAMLSRLGAEAEDPLDEFLNLALAYERTATPSLQGFMHWVAAEETEVKRDLEQGDRDEVRVMTVHGAKGLQAPIVILADTVSSPQAGASGRPSIFWSGGIPLWAPRRASECTLVRHAREAAGQADMEEYNRLLYVAMTRAEDRLYIVGAKGRSEPPDDCWYNMVVHGLARVGAAEDFDFTEMAAGGWSGGGYVLSSETEEFPDSLKPVIEETREAEEPAGWMLLPPPEEPTPPTPLAPSRPSIEDPPVRSPISERGNSRFRRGLLVHRLLELLPEVAPDRRRETCLGYLARPLHALEPEAQAELADEVMNVLEHPEFGSIFGVDSRAEVALAGAIPLGGQIEIVSGQVDRMVVTERDVFVVDYKTMRPVPTSASVVPTAYLRQLAIYRALLRGVWPDREFRGALLWTEGPSLMPICDGLLDRYSAAS